MAKLYSFLYFTYSFFIWWAFKIDFIFWHLGEHCDEDVLDVECGGPVSSAPDIQGQSECENPNQDVQGHVTIGRRVDTAVSLYALLKHALL